MSTKIYAVEYWITERYNGKTPSTYKSNFSIVAKDGQDAINKVKEKALKPFNYTNDEKKKVSVTKSSFEVISVSLLAESD